MAAVVNERSPRCVLVRCPWHVFMSDKRNSRRHPVTNISWRVQRYAGRRSHSAFYTSMAILNCTRWRTGSQWSCCRTGVMCLHLLMLVMRCAVLFWTKMGSSGHGVHRSALVSGGYIFNSERRDCRTAALLIPTHFLSSRPTHSQKQCSHIADSSGLWCNDALEICQRKLVVSLLPIATTRPGVWGGGDPRILI